MTKGPNKPHRFYEAKRAAFRAAIQAYCDRLNDHAKLARVEQQFNLEQALIEEIEDKCGVANEIMFRMSLKRKGDR